MDHFYFLFRHLISNAPVNTWTVGHFYFLHSSDSPRIRNPPSWGSAKISLKRSCYSRRTEDAQTFLSSVSQAGEGQIQRQNLACPLGMGAKSYPQMWQTAASTLVVQWGMWIYPFPGFSSGGALCPQLCPQQRTMLYTMLTVAITQPTVTWHWVWLSAESHITWVTHVNRHTKPKQGWDNNPVIKCLLCKHKGLSSIPAPT